MGLRVLKLLKWEGCVGDTLLIGSSSQKRMRNVSKSVPVQVVSLHRLWKSKAGEVKSGWGVLKSFCCLLWQPGLMASNCSVFAPIQLRWHLFILPGHFRDWGRFLWVPLRPLLENHFQGKWLGASSLWEEGTPLLPALPLLSSCCPNAWFCLSVCYFGDGWRGIIK